MSVLQRFEKRLEGLVEGAFAKVFKGVVHPVEILNAMQREAEAHKAILAGGRTLVPNRYVIDLSPYDHSRLAPYAAALAQELAQSQAEFIGEQGWTVYGDVIVEIERGDGLDTGMFRVTAEVYTGADGQFSLYEDNGRNYGYERGESARIPLAWNEASGELSIGAREGGYPGMREARELRVRFVDGPRGDNGALEPAADVTVRYEGRAQVVARPAT